MEANADSEGGRLWFAAPMLLLAATAALGAVLYPGLPDPVPIHWDVGGMADGYAPKSVLAVFAPLLIGAGLVAFLWLLHRFLPAMATNNAHGDPRRAAAEARAGKRVLANLTPALGVLLSWLCVRGWLELTGPWTIWLPMILLLAFTGVLVARAVREVSLPPGSEEPR